jgi:hypothetical protein
VREHTNHFYYDAMLRRYAVEDSSGVRYFTWDTNGMNLLAERDAAGTVVAGYTHGYAPVPGIGSCVGQELVQSGATYYEFDICDHRGSVVRRVNAAGQVTGYFEYDAWGNALRDEETGASSRFRYQSNWIQLPDDPDKGLYLSPTRVYHAGVGRFLGRDPRQRFLVLGRLGIYEGTPVGDFMRGYASELDDQYLLPGPAHGRPGSRSNTLTQVSPIVPPTNNSGRRVETSGAPLGGPAGTEESAIRVADVLAGRLRDWTTSSPPRIEVIPATSPASGSEEVVDALAREASLSNLYIYPGARAAERVDPTGTKICGCLGPVPVDPPPPPPECTVANDGAIVRIWLRGTRPGCFPITRSWLNCICFMMPFAVVCDNWTDFRCAWSPRRNSGLWFTVRSGDTCP